MKRLLFSIPLLAAVLVMCGCHTTPPAPGQPSQLAVNIGIAMYALVPDAVVSAATKYPETVPYMAASADLLGRAAGNPHISPAQLQADLDALPLPDTAGAFWAKAAVRSGVSLYAGLSKAGLINAVDANYCLNELSNDILLGLQPGATVESIKAKTKTARSKYAALIKKG